MSCPPFGSLVKHFGHDSPSAPTKIGGNRSSRWLFGVLEVTGWLRFGGVGAPAVVEARSSMPVGRTTGPVQSLSCWEHRQVDGGTGGPNDGGRGRGPGRPHPRGPSARSLDILRGPLCGVARR